MNLALRAKRGFGQPAPHQEHLFHVITYTGGAYRRDLGITGLAHIKAVSGHCEFVPLEVQLGWLMTSTLFDIEPVIVGTYAGGHTGLREFSGTGRGS